MLIEDAVEAAHALPADGWLGRVVEGAPMNALERLLAAVRAQVHARAEPNEAGYGLETEIAEPSPALVEAAAEAARALGAAERP